MAFGPSSLCGSECGVCCARILRKYSRIFEKKTKLNADGTIERYKARWVARGFTQRRYIDFDEKFSPTIRSGSMRTLLSVGNALDYEIKSMDVKNAFPQAEVSECIYVEQPHGYEEYDINGIPLVCKLDKSLYGLMQAARNWNTVLQLLNICYLLASLSAVPMFAYFSSVCLAAKSCTLASTLTIALSFVLFPVIMLHFAMLLTPVSLLWTLVILLGF